MADAARVYIDSCCFIDMVKVSVGKVLVADREKNVWFLKRLLEANRDREIEIFTSTITIAECTHIGEERIKETVKSQFSRLLTSGQYVRLVQVTPFIAEDARDLRWKHGINLKGADGIHIASALDRKCEEFLSTDGRFKRVNEHSTRLARMGLKIKQGKDTECLPEKYRQLDLEDEKPN
jgi:predicted nucleic acid-binding protein